MIRAIVITLSLIGLFSIIDTAQVASFDHAIRHAGGILLGIGIGILTAADVRAHRDTNDWWPAPWKDDDEEIDRAP